jgi:bifunctional non-homologous end joining protein LigD
MIELDTAPGPQLSAPDRFILDLDLDHDPSSAWDMMRDGAVLLKVLLDEVGLDSHFKTSEAKGR